MEFNEDNYRFNYKTNSDWNNLGGDLDGKDFSTRVAGGFVGTNFGMYTTSSGEFSANKASYEWFSYSGNDDVYSGGKE